MGTDRRGCGPLYDVYITARDGDTEALNRAWSRAKPIIDDLDTDHKESLEEARANGDLDTIQRRTADLVFQDAETPTLDGMAATVIGTLLYWLGYAASFVLFFKAHSRETVVARLRWAYRTVGVQIQGTETDGDIERTVFRCPYRNLGEERYGRRHTCHDVLDRVDDGYVTFLERRRGLDYQRPRACAASDCCYSEVSEQ